MKREALVSGGDALRRVSICSEVEIKRVQLEQAGALCSADDSVFCACASAIWRLDKESLTPRALFAGGPGAVQLLLSADAQRLYVLCAEADSVLMVDAKTGMPLLLNHAGVNPRQMAIDGNVLAVAGGESGYVDLFCAQTLRLLDRLTAPGPVYSVAFCAGKLFALCLTASLSSQLITAGGGMLALAGMPGQLLADGSRLLVSTDGMLHAVSAETGRLLARQRAPGRASWMGKAGGKLLLLDVLSERLYALERGAWRLLCEDAAFAGMLDT